jgi:large subunit ribosomal protein L11
VEEVATVKMPDLSAADIEAGKRTVEGSVRSMGIKLDYK